MVSAKTSEWIELIKGVFRFLLIKREEKHVISSFKSYIVLLQAPKLFISQLVCLCVCVCESCTVLKKVCVCVGGRDVD